MSLVTPTTPTVVTAPIPAAVLATATLGTRSTLDLRTKWGAWVYPRIGRRAATALTVACRIVIRRTFNNDATLHVSQSLDRVSSTAAVIATTLNGNTSIGATTAVLTSGTSFAAGDIVCLSDASATEVEFARVSSISTNTLTFDAPLKLAHTSGIAVTNGADVFAPVFLAGGATYEFRADNGASGQSVVFELLAATYDSDTIA
jgi:hypothetical protein